MTQNSAYILITCHNDKFDLVIEQLEHLSGIKEFQGTYGSYDIVAKFESITRQNTPRLISEQIRNLSGVRSALTLECKPAL